MKECCGTCCYHLPYYKDHFSCENEQADGYGEETDYDEVCDCYKQKGTSTMGDKIRRRENSDQSW